MMIIAFREITLFNFCHIVILLLSISRITLELVIITSFPKITVPNNVISLLIRALAIISRTYSHAVNEPKAHSSAPFASKETLSDMGMQSAIPQFAHLFRSFLADFSLAAFPVNTYRLK